MGIVINMADFRKQRPVNVGGLLAEIDALEETLTEIRRMILLEGDYLVREKMAIQMGDISFKIRALKDRINSAGQ